MQINIFFKYAIYNFLKKIIFLQTNHFHMAYIKNIKIYLYTYEHYNFQCYTMTLRCNPFILFYNASSPAGCATPAGPKGAIKPIAEGSYGGGCSRTCRRFLSGPQACPKAIRLPDFPPCPAGLASGAPVPPWAAWLWPGTPGIPAPGPAW